MATNPILISAKELKNKNPKSLPQKADEFSNVGFWSYTSLQSLDKILESGFFFASNLAIMNDKNEKELHSGGKHDVLAFEQRRIYQFHGTFHGVVAPRRR